MQQNDDLVQADRGLAPATIIGHCQIVKKVGAVGPSEVQVNWTENISLSLLAVRPTL